MSARTEKARGLDLTPNFREEWMDIKHGPDRIACLEGSRSVVCDRRSGRIDRPDLALNKLENSFAQDRKTDRVAATASLDAAMARVLETGGAAIVAEIGRDIVGYLFLASRVEARNLGIGTALLREAERITGERNVSRLIVRVLVDNSQAISFYRFLGFVTYSLEMAKHLPSTATG